MWLSGEVCACASLAVWLAQGKTGQSQEGRINTTENESFWFRDFSSLWTLKKSDMQVFFPTQTLLVLDYRAALVQLLSPLQIKVSLLSMTFCRKRT